jgi:ankyrin repeat protein
VAAKATANQKKVLVRLNAGPGQTPLAIAAVIGDEKKAEILLDLGANPETRDERGMTQLELAKGGKHKAVVELFRSRNIL